MSNYSDSMFDYTSANTSWYKVFNLIPDGSHVLDVGCSSGNFGKELSQRKNCVVDGVEVSKSDAAIARKNLRKVYNLNIETDSTNEISEQYDIIYFGDVIEHLINPVTALKRISKHLKPSGRLVFSIPNMAYIGIRLELLKGNFEYTETGILDKTHLHFYTLDEIEVTLNESGFEIEILDFVQKDYPKELISKTLGELGLSAKRSFYDQLQQPEASAFQFVGSAKLSKVPRKVSREKFGPIDLFEKYLNDTKSGYEDEIKILKEENRMLELEIKSITHHPVRHYLRILRRKIKNKL